MKKLKLSMGAALMISSSFLSAFAAPANMPKLGAVDFKPPKGSRHILENGLVVYMLKDATLPVIHMTAIVRAGKIYDPKEKIGLTELAVSLLKDGGTAKYKSDDIDKTLEFLGASVETSAAMEETRADMTVLKKDLDKVLDIYSEVLINPAFEEDKTKILKDQTIELIRRRNDDPAKEAQREAVRMFYGSDHPYGWRPEISTIEAITKEDLKAFHSNFFKPNNTILVVSGDYASDEAMLSLLKDKFGSWEKGETAFPALPPVNIPEGRRVYHIEKDSSQTSIVVLMRGLRRHDPAEYPLSVINELLGGGIQSRLGNEIRSKRGLAYTVYSYFLKRPDYGYINAYCGTKPETMSQALSEILKQMDILKKDPIPAEELKRGKDSIINSFVFRFPTPFSLVSERALYEYYAYPTAYLDEYVSNIEKVTSSSALETSSKLFNTGNALIFVIGNSKKFDKPLSDFGQVTELKED